MTEFELITQNRTYKASKTKEGWSIKFDDHQTGVSDEFELHEDRPVIKLFQHLSQLEKQEQQRS